jgi:hypothetical protein
VFRELFPIITTTAMRRAFGFYRAPDGGFGLWVYADDCDAVVEQLRGHGVPVIEEPSDQPGASGSRRSRIPTATA